MFSVNNDDFFDFSKLKTASMKRGYMRKKVLLWYVSCFLYISPCHSCTWLYVRTSTFM